jgi:glycerate kinase
MRVLVAPDKFKGTLSAREAAEAIARGWRRGRPRDELELVPLADGGEGTLDALVGERGRTVSRDVTGPRGDAVRAAFGIADGVAVVEMARASGLGLLAPARRDPLRTTTRGTGQLIRAALDEGARRVFVCVGGSATNDGGVGMAAALGAALLDPAGFPIGDGGAALLDLATIDLSGLDPRLRAAEVTGLVDVDNPLCGPNGASATFGPQKGASPDDVVLLDRALAHLAAVVERDLGVDLRDEPGAGAAGGLGFGLIAFLGARLRPGAATVMEAAGFEASLEAADLVITGEGSFDAQSLRGKVPAAVLAAAERAGVPAAIICGTASERPAGVTLRTLVERVGPRAALADARRSLELVAEELARQGRG